MKIKKPIATLLVLCLLLPIAVCFAGAAGTAQAVPAVRCRCCDTEVIIHSTDISEITRQRILASFGIGEAPEMPERGITCDLFGHNLQVTNTTTILHMQKANPPRCKQLLYSVETCTRCDYQNRILLNTTYIYCCD